MKAHPRVLLGPGVEQVADLPRRVAGAATVHFEDEREEARPGRGADRGRGRHMAVEAVALAAGCSYKYSYDAYLLIRHIISEVRYG